MALLTYLKLTDKLACQGTVITYGVLHPDDLSSASDIQALDDSESLTFSYARLNRYGETRAISAQMRAGRVLTVLWSDAAFDEWRIARVTEGRGRNGVVTVECVPIWRDLVERCDNASGRGWVSELIGGERVYEYELTERTATSILTDFVVANAPSYVTLGTITPTRTIPSLSVDHMTPWGLARAVCDALHALDVTCELRLRRNGTTDYQIDLVTQVGASAGVAVFHPTNSLLTLERKTDATSQATRVMVNGGTAPDTLPGILGRARWLVDAPSGTTLPLTDPNGGTSPVAFDNQFVGQFLYRVLTGKTFAITDSDAATGTVTCGGGVSDIAAGELVEFRLDEPMTNSRRQYTLTPYKEAMFWVEAVSGSKLRISARISWNGVSPVVGSTTDKLDWRGRRATFIVEQQISTSVADTTSYPPATRKLTMTVGTTGMQVGDYILFSAFLRTWITSFDVHNVTFVVDHIDAVNKYVWVHSLHGYDAANYGGYAWCYRPDATTHIVTAADPVNPWATRYQITGTDNNSYVTLAGDPITINNQYAGIAHDQWLFQIFTAAGLAVNSPQTPSSLVALTDRVTGTIPDLTGLGTCYVEFEPRFGAQRDVTVDAVGAAVAGDIIEFDQPCGAGERPAYVDHPVYAQADPTGYGVKVMELSKPNYAGVTQLIANPWVRDWSAGLPVGWALQSGSGTNAQDTTTTRFGESSWSFAAANTRVIRTPRADVAWDDSHVYISARAWVYFTALAGCQPKFSICSLQSDGTAIPLVSPAQLFINAVGEGGGVTTQVETGVWVELKIEGVTLGDNTAQFGMAALFEPGGAACFLDAIEVYPFATCPDVGFEYGDATSLMQAANQTLAEVAAPLVYYTMQIRDLARAFPDEYARNALTLGANVRAIDADYGIDTTVRLLKLERDLLQGLNTALTLANRPALLTDVTQLVDFTTQPRSTKLISSAGGTPTPTEPAPDYTITKTATDDVIPTGANVTASDDSSSGVVVQDGASFTKLPVTSDLPTMTVAVDLEDAAPRTSPFTALRPPRLDLL